MRRCGGLWLFLGAIIVIAASVRTAIATSAVLDKPIYAEVYLKTAAPRPVKVAGNLTEYDDTRFTLQVGKESKSLTWAEITPSSAFVLRQRVTDKNSAPAMLELGRFGYELGATEQAQIALKAAVKLDPSLKERADAVLASPASPSASSSETPTTAPSTEEGPNPIPQPGKKKADGAERIKFQPATPEQAANALKLAREQSQKVASDLNVNLVETETDHFIIFTDWDPREQNFLKTNLEDAYKCVAKQFEMSPKDNVFVGKLPVYMFAKFADFSKFASKLDGFPVTNRVAGYYKGEDNGYGHMAMWKPNESLTGSNNIHEAERLWAYVLTHEFTHAFLARYRSNAFIPRWMNEGIAEVIASSQFPYPERRSMAKIMALRGGDLSFLFDDENMPSGEYYPVMQTMVELLIKADQKKFIKLIDAIKDGEKPEEALKKLYNTDYDKLARTWREWAKR